MAQTDRIDRTVLITGASRRIGKAIAIDLASRGWTVALHYGSRPLEADAACREIERAGGRAVAIGADLARSDACEALIGECAGRIGPLTCLVNNASLFVEDDIHTIDAAVWDSQIAVNLRAPVLLAKAFAAQLPDGANGSIINIIDQRVLAPTPAFFSYGISKAGLLAATRMLAQALAPRIRVNGIGPGPVLKSLYQSDEDFAAEAQSTLLSRAVDPAEIAAGVRFILDAPSLTGQMIALDAGQHLVWRSEG